MQLLACRLCCSLSLRCSCLRRSRRRLRFLPNSMLTFGIVSFSAVVDNSSSIGLLAEAITITGTELSDTHRSTGALCVQQLLQLHHLLLCRILSSLCLLIA